MIEYKIDKDNPNPVIIQKAAEAIINGKVVIFPTDTSYGLAANPISEQAIERLYLIKNDLKKKPISVIVRDKQMAKKYAVIENESEKFFDKYLPGSVTLIYPAKREDFLPNQNPSFRIPGTPLTNMLSDLLDFPYTATSANLTRYEPAYTPEKIYEYFKSNKPQPDIFLNAGELEINPPSTVVDLITTPPKIIRQGPTKIDL
ncbi:MAG: L-threonylcarbamoyladenylate synthase [bacterium]|nr:L-threonylcarbamoyladenylate synthase [bacterium]